MLDLMGMTKYQKNFQEAGIDGGILCQCDDTILVEVFNITTEFWFACLRR